MTAAKADGAGVSALTVDSAVLSVFWDLASVQTAKREARNGRRRRQRVRPERTH